jgi:hypothetical protein
MARSKSSVASLFAFIARPITDAVYAETGSRPSAAVVVRVGRRMLSTALRALANRIDPTNRSITRVPPVPVPAPVVPTVEPELAPVAVEPVATPEPVAVTVPVEVVPVPPAPVAMVEPAAPKPARKPRAAKSAPQVPAVLAKSAKPTHKPAKARPTAKREKAAPKPKAAPPRKPAKSTGRTAGM